MQPRPRLVESHLGDVIGAVPALRLPYPRRFDHPRWIERGVQVVVTAFAVTVCAVLLVALVLSLFLARAHGHGPAAWIERGGYKNAAGELCCGERDCFELADADVKVKAAGYFVVSTKETIPFAEATPSPDGKFWRCQWGGARKCFFAPLGQT